MAMIAMPQGAVVARFDEQAGVPRSAVLRGSRSHTSTSMCTVSSFICTDQFSRPSRLPATASFESLDTPAARAAVAARDLVFEQFVYAHHAACATIAAATRRRLDALAQWEGSWRAMAAQLETEL